MRWSGSLKKAARLWRLCRIPRLPFTPRSRSRPDSAATQPTREAERWMSRLSTTTCQREALASLATTPCIWARKSARVTGRPGRGCNDLPADHIAADEEPHRCHDGYTQAHGAPPGRASWAGSDACALRLARPSAHRCSRPARLWHPGWAPRDTRRRCLGLCASQVSIPRRGQPIAPAVRLLGPLFKSRAAWRSEISETMPRRLISAAISRPVHWLMGRPERSGASQASATILADLLIGD